MRKKKRSYLKKLTIRNRFRGITRKAPGRALGRLGGLAPSGVSPRRRRKGTRARARARARVPTGAIWIKFSRKEIKRFITRPRTITTRRK